MTAAIIPEHNLVMLVMQFPVDMSGTIVRSFLAFILAVVTDSGSTTESMSVGERGNLMALRGAWYVVLLQAVRSIWRLANLSRIASPSYSYRASATTAVLRGQQLCTEFAYKSLYKIHPQ